MNAMRRCDVADLLLLGALWGASFLFMRLGAADFGPAALLFLRVGGACLLLLPLLWRSGQAPALRAHWRAIGLVGLTNSALPFALFMTAALVLSAGLAAIFNATAALWAAVFAWAWLGDRPTKWRALGLVIGFAGVLGLAIERASFKAGEHGISPALAVLCCIVATLLYGWSAAYTKKRLTGLPPMALACGSQLSSAVASALPAWWLWPQTTPPASAWAAAAALAFACTALAYVLYFRLIASVGPANATTVTYLVPLFAVVWGAVFLGERPGTSMVIGCGVILLGTALSTGLLPLRRKG